MVKKSYFLPQNFSQNHSNNKKLLTTYESDVVAEWLRREVQASSTSS